LEKVH